MLVSAARLQEIVPDAVLVGDSAAALYAGHRDSFDHDHVLTDLIDRYATRYDVSDFDGFVSAMRAMDAVWLKDWEERRERAKKRAEAQANARAKGKR